MKMTQSDMEERINITIELLKEVIEQDKQKAESSNRKDCIIHGKPDIRHADDGSDDQDDLEDFILFLEDSIDALGELTGGLDDLRSFLLDRVTPDTAGVPEGSLIAHIQKANDGIEDLKPETGHTAGNIPVMFFDIPGENVRLIPIEAAFRICRSKSGRCITEKVPGTTDLYFFFGEDRPIKLEGRKYLPYPIVVIKKEGNGPVTAPDAVDRFQARNYINENTENIISYGYSCFPAMLLP